MSEIDEFKIINKLDNSDQEKIRYFLKLLINEKKYKRLRMEIEKRRQKIAKGETITHDEIWKPLDV